MFHFSRYWVFRSWGRVGTVIGSNKLEQMPSKEDAVEHFLNLYEEKTGNSWHSKNFTKYPKKFYPLEIDYGQVTEMSLYQAEHCWAALLWLLCSALTVASHLTNLRSEVQVQLLHLLCYRKGCRSTSVMHWNRYVGKLSSFPLSSLKSLECSFLFPL